MAQSVEAREGYRASPQQARIRRLAREGAASSYTTEAWVRVDGRLDLAILQRALASAAQRYEILRTRLVDVGEADPVQVIAATLDTRVESIASLDETSWTCAVEERTDEHARIRFALPAWCVDEEGMEALITSVARSYAALAAGEIEPEPDDDAELVAYADAAEYAQQLLESEEAEWGRDYWRAQLAGVPDAASVTPAALVPPIDVGECVLDEPLRAGLATVAAQWQCGVEEVLQTAWQVLRGGIQAKRKTS